MEIHNQQTKKIELEESERSYPSLDRKIQEITSMIQQEIYSILKEKEEK